jgi:hypothetical protein
MEIYMGYSRYIDGNSSNRYTHYRYTNMNAITNLYDYNNYEFDTKPSMRLHFQPKRAFNLECNEYECELEDVIVAVPYEFSCPKARKEIGFTYMVTLKRWKREWREEQERLIVADAIRRAANWR